MINSLLSVCFCSLFCLSGIISEICIPTIAFLAGVRGGDFYTLIPLTPARDVCITLKR
jgi:hypothetical protein